MSSFYKGSAVITIRIDRELRRRMKALKGVNWSQIVREAILKRIAVEERKEALKRLTSFFVAS